MVQRAPGAERRASQPVAVRQPRQAPSDRMSTAGPGSAHARLSDGDARRVPGPVAAAQPAAPSPPPAPVPEPPTTAGRPAPTRTEVLAAFQAASPSPSSAAANAVASPAPAPPAALAPAPMSHVSPAPLARLRTGDDPAPIEQRFSAQQAQSAAPDLDALADYVLERLRRELRDGRERLGFLLDDSHR